MLRWMCGHTKKDKIRNEIIRNNLEVVPIEEKMKDQTKMVWSCKKKTKRHSCEES